MTSISHVTMYSNSIDNLPRVPLIRSYNRASSKKIVVTTLSFVFLFLSAATAQQGGKHDSIYKMEAEYLENQEHYSNPHFRAAILLGHTLIKSQGTNSHLFIPSWGLDLEYWVNHTWGIGMHNDIEIESFIIRQSDEEEIERVNPLVLTLDVLYRFDNGMVLSLGPGLEYEQGESYYLARFGVEYEKEIGGGYDISPAVFYDQRLDGFATYTIALGVGKRF